MATTPLRRVPPVATSFARVQQGLGELIASSDSHGITRLTRVSHQAPVRLIPLRSSAVNQAGAAVSVLSNYGGGLLPGDCLHHDITVNPKAKLGLITQGSNRIYRQRGNIKQACRTRLCATVQENALLVVAPDPVTPFCTSIYEQHQTIHIDPTASLCLMDWFSSGRFVNGERWEQERLTNRMELYFSDSSHPVIIDSVSLNQQTAPSYGMDWNSVQFNAYASIFLYGDQVQSIVEHCQSMSEQLCHPFTSIRESKYTQGDQTLLNLDHLSGRVLLGVSPVSTRHGTVHVARLAAASNEDLYRVFHHILQPLQSSFGMEFYKERIRAVSSPAVVETTKKTQASLSFKEVTEQASSIEATVNPPITDSSYWSAFMLADSALPTGSFAHSSGLEAAAQLGIVSDANDVSEFVAAAVRSTLQLSSPLVLSSHRLWKERMADSFRDDWVEMDSFLQALLASNAPACRASLDQGSSLLRVATKWYGENKDVKAVLKILQDEVSLSSTTGHLPTVFGIITALCKLDEQQACQLLGYCVARDIVSAAVRLNLVGPLASVGMLAQAQQAAEEGIRSGQLLLEEDCWGAGCSPILDAIQPCHDLLAVRLFRT